MSTKDFTANVISATKVVPDGNFKDSKASGIWDINEALDLIKGGNWPNVANFNPASFVDGLFQTHLYEGNGGTQTITNNINLSGSGGLVWLKDRESTEGYFLYDTERGATKRLFSHNTNAEATESQGLTSFNSNGFTNGANGNSNGQAYVSWTFRKQPKFFDIVTYTGNSVGLSAQTISHNLGSNVGMIIVKATSATSGSADWTVWHRYNANGTGFLNVNDAFYTTISSTYISSVSSTSFAVGHNVNTNGVTFVAYLFAHNNNDGGFGEPGDQDIISCGSYTGNGSADGPEINLGFEPQWLITKNTSSADNWKIVDNMRGMVSGGTDAILTADTDTTESYNSAQYFNPTSTGFKIVATNVEYNKSSDTYIYMAIRRGGMQTPTAASSVFAVDQENSSEPYYTSGFPVDFALTKNPTSAQAWRAYSRLTQTRELRPDTNGAEGGEAKVMFDYMDGHYSGSEGANVYSWMWKRARGYFDVCCYSGTGSAQNINHNLGVVPEMMWIKRRDSTGSWNVYHKGLNGGTNPEQHVIYLEANEASNSGGSAVFNNTAPTSSVFTVNTNNGVNNSSGTYIAYLFATVSGVSKVGSFTQSGATNVDCGFTGDTPSLIIYKRTDGGGNWHIYDSVRGIAAGNDAYLLLDNTGNEQSSDYIDPYSGGFATTSGVTNGDYIFYAIAATS